MTLQQVIDAIAGEIASIKKRAEGDTHYVRGAQDTLERLVTLMNAPEEQAKEPDDNGTEKPQQ